MSIEGLLKNFCLPKSSFTKEVSQGMGQIGKELDIYKYLRRAKRTDAIFEYLLSKKQRVLIEHQDKVRFLVDDLTPKTNKVVSDQSIASNMAQPGSDVST